MLKQHDHNSYIDIWWVPVFQRDKLNVIADCNLNSDLKSSLDQVLSNLPYKATLGEIWPLFNYPGLEVNVGFFGLGDEKKAFHDQQIRSGLTAVANWSLKKTFKEIGLYLCDQVNANLQLEALSLGLYAFEKYLSEPKVTIPNVSFHPNTSVSIDEIQKIIHASHVCRNLVNMNADDVNPAYLADYAQKIADEKLKVSVYDHNQLEAMGFHLACAVGRASSSPSKLICLHYQGDPKAVTISLVGKAITYDTGGLNIKPTGSMETMKCDMAGGAAVLATIQAIKELKLPVNVVACMFATENNVDSVSYKPGDVYKSLSGKYVEVGNTDAEGRLTLADMLTWTCKEHNPDYVIDIATLTGAAEVALGPEYAALMTDNACLKEAIESASKSTGEKVWQLPLPSSYLDLLKSDIADLKNIGGRAGGAITAAVFLQQFVGEKPWAHLDIAAPAYLSSSRGFLPKNATGWGVRLLLETVKRLSGI